MSRTFTLADGRSLEDLRTFFSRAARIEEGAVRLIADSGVLAAYAAVFYPVGLLDETPTVLGLRTLALVPQEGEERAFDVVVPVRSLLQRMETAALTASIGESDGPVTVALPMEVHTVTWAAISPPRGGWYPLEAVDGGMLERVAQAGIDTVATALPDGAGEQIVRTVRSQVWDQPIDGMDHIPAAAAFAAFGLGFLGDPEVRVFETGPWTRLTTARGHVLVKRRAWTLAR